MSDEMKNGNSYEVSTGCNETLKNRFMSSLGVYMKKLGVPFLAILNNLFLGEMMIANLLNFTQDKVFKIFEFNLRLLHFHW